MVGGGIFATTGLAVQTAKGAVPIAFVASGIVALLTCYSYLKLSLRFPSRGGTVTFINRGFGVGIVSGSINILLSLSYVILVAIYAYAFGSYASGFFPPEQHDFWHHAFLSGALILLAALNLFGGHLVIRSEDLFNAVKMVLLTVFVVAGLVTHMQWQRLGSGNYSGPVAILSGAMVVFFNYEGFELISNAAPDVKDPRRSLPIAFVGGVLAVIVFYVLIAVVVLGHMTVGEVKAVSDHALAPAAGRFMGTGGRVTIAIAAMIATVSAINATFYSSGGLTYCIAASGELPKELQRNIMGRPEQGMFIFAALALVLGNLVPLSAIAAAGSAGFLFVFMAVNLANLRLADETRSRRWISFAGALACAAAIVVLCLEVDENPATHNQIWIVLGMITLSVIIELLYRLAKKVRK